MPSAVVDGQVVTRQSGGDEAADQFPVRATARPRGEPPHHLAEIAGGACARLGDGRLDEGTDFVLAQCLRQVLGQDFDLGLFLAGKVGTVRLAVGLDRLPAGLDLAGQHTQEFVIREWLLVALLQVVRRARGHAQDIAAQRITAAHRGGDVGLELFSKGHRSWLPRAVALDAREAAGG
ncbi:MAG: hypothetical protein WKF78_05060 [Candidatus Limnocylindrales bacterium]